MAAHLPGAPDVAAFRANLRAGRCAMRRLTPDELAAAGEDPARAALPNYVPVAAELEGWRAFDAGFFGFGPKDAAILDPQHRRFLEVAWAALEDAGRPPESVPGPVGIWAGCGTNGYLWTHLASHPDLVEGTGMFLLRHTGNDKDFLATRVAHLFDLTGPAVGVQTACSTSLVAIHYAAQALLSGECDMALAGGVTIDLPQGRGYLFNENEILAPDGVCRAFDAGAAGTLFGSGAGVVVLRRLADALAAGDRIRAVIAGSAVTNDGAAKAGYLAPGVDGQARAIFEALAMAGAAPETIGHVEAHGTGTRLGDPIEVAALNTAFARAADTLSGGRRPAAGSIALGSVKPSIGHLDTAAGVAGLIKAVIALEDREIAPSLHYTAPNPEIDFAGGPFRVAERLAPFPAPPGGGPRRAGVTALGVGGTNAHVVLEEAPARPVAAPSDWPFQLLAVSGRDARARDAATDRLAAHLAAGPADDLADIAFTLIEGRRAFPARRVVVAETAAEAATHLAARTRGRVFDHHALPGTPEVVFLLPGGGAQYPAMARDLYETEPAFRDAMDEALALMATIAGDDLRALWLPEPGGEADTDTAAALRRPSLQLPLILAVEVALARLWASWGVRPAALVGHSMGENAAACLAGVMSLGDALRLVHARGRLFDRLGGGGMLSVPLPEDEVAARLGPDLDLACVNAPGLCVVSGPRPALAEFARALEADGIEAQEVAIDVAAHSRAIEPVLAEFRAVVAGLKLSPPALPVHSNRTGRPLTAAEATDPDYWVGHLRGTVRFAQALAAADAPNRVLLEVGPGQTLGALARACGVPAGRVVASLRHQGHAIADDLHFVTALGRL
ncbi:MAG: type I polyketide synthase, partial [Rhodobacteraceae bacterium]|nr:type I polyketide synthase [Paracoccaceae bacterium]